MYSSKFCLGHQLNGSWGELTENVNNVVISYGLEDLLTVERLGYYRAGGWDTNEKRYKLIICLLYTSPSPRDGLLSRMPSSA